MREIEQVRDASETTCGVVQVVQVHTMGGTLRQRSLHQARHGQAVRPHPVLQHRQRTEVQHSENYRSILCAEALQLFQCSSVTTIAPARLHQPVRPKYERLRQVEIDPPPPKLPDPRTRSVWP